MRLSFKLFLIFLIWVAVVAGLGYRWATRPVSLKTTPVDFRIPPGASLRSAASIMVDSGIRVRPSLLVWMGKLAGAETGIRAGSYSVSRGVTPWEILGKLTRGQVSQGEIVLVEGWTFRQWRERMDAHPELRHETRGLSEDELLKRLGIEGVARAEGLFFPDTYLFDKQSSDTELLARAYRTMRKKLEFEWEQRAPGLPYKEPYQALTMASIIEKETGRPADRKLVAAVFVNRLKTGMLLQTDPTVIYGMGQRFDGNIRKRDLTTDTPYNTYTRTGLPPSPIAMPSLASIQAALHPAESDALYFVARGDGSSHFSNSLDEHNRAVSRYQRNGR